jgi:hypothetical protein
VWDGEAVDAARGTAEASGVVARRVLPAVPHRSGRWAALAEGYVDEDGVHIVLRVVDPATGTVMRQSSRSVLRDWHVLRGLLHGLAWRRDEAVIEPLRRAEEMLGVPPTVQMSDG